MVQVMIRLQNKGVRNHPYWWIVVQPKSKCLKGRVIERVGLWIPRRTNTVDRAVIFNKYKLRYWLSVGATPSDKVHHLLTLIDFLPKKPHPFGSAQKIERKPRTYKMEYFHHHRWAFNDKEIQKSYFYGKIKELEALMNRHMEFEKSAINEIIKPEDINLKYNKKQSKFEEDMDTDQINSDEGEFFARKHNFDIVSKKLDKYMKEKFHLFRGKDLKYNNYVRKIQKLSMKQSLDIEGYKDYIENLKKLTESKNKTFQSIAKIYLKDLTEKENFSEIFKKLNLNETVDLNTLDKDKVLSLAEKDCELILKNLSAGFDSVVDNVFNLNEANKEKIKEESAYKDLVNLRIAKMIIKLKTQIEGLKLILNSEEYLQEENLDLFPFLNNEKIAKFEEKLKILQNDLSASQPKITSSYNEFEEALFSKMNSYLLSTETLKKYSKFLLDNYSSDASAEAPLEISQNAFENIFSLNTELIDKLMLVLVDKLSKSYEVNEMFQDELKDLAQFEKEELLRVQRRFTMKSELFALQKKHGPMLNILYDDFQGTSEEIKSDVRSFKNKYREEIEAELDIKFREVFKLLADKTPKTMYKYDDPVEFENDQKYIEKFERIRAKIMEEIRAMQNGTYKEPEESPQTKREKKSEAEQIAADEELRLENTIRRSLQMKFLGLSDRFGDMLPKFYDDDVPSELQSLLIPKKVFKGHKVPFEEEKKMINRRLKRFYDLINYSKTESTVISKERVELIKERFVENFGRYNEIIYPDGFRHLESFEMYQSVYPLRTMPEYISECREACDFKKFVEIVYGAINQIKKIILLGFEFPELYRKLNYLPIYMHTKRPEFIVSLKEIYKRNLQLAEKRNIPFTVLDAIEYVCEFKLIDSILPEIASKLELDDAKRMAEVISTDRYTTMKLHDFDTPKNKDLGLNRQGPFMPINPLKAHKANPFIDKPLNKLSKNFPYRMKSRGFCTKI